MQLIDKEDHFSFGVFDLADHRLESLLELATEFGTGDQAAHVQGDHTTVLERLRNIPLHDPLRKSFGNRRLADPRLADQYRVVLGPTREDLDHPSDLIVPADDRIEFVLGSLRDKIDPVLFQSLEFPLRALVRHPSAAPDALESLEDFFFVHAQELQKLRGVLFGFAKSQKQVFGTDKLVLHSLGGGGCRLETFLQGCADARLPIAAGPRKPLKLACRRRLEFIDLGADFLQQGDHDPGRVLEQGGQKMKAFDFGVSLRSG